MGTLLLPCSRILWKSRHGSEGRKKEWGWVLSGGKNQKVLVWVSLVAQTVKNPCNARDLGSIPESGRSPGEGNGNSLQYSCLGNPMDRRIWWSTIHGVSHKLSDVTNTFYCFILILTHSIIYYTYNIFFDYKPSALRKFFLSIRL